MPKSYSQEERDRIMNDIILRMGAGESLRSICDKNGVPARSTVLKWIDDDTELQVRYVRAIQDGCEVYLDEIVEIADNVEPTAEAVAKARLMVDVRKWIACKRYARKYGDKVQLSGDAENPVQVEHKLTPEQMGASVNFLLNKALQQAEKEKLNQAKVSTENGNG